MALRRREKPQRPTCGKCAMGWAKYSKDLKLSANAWSLMVTHSSICIRKSGSTVVCKGMARPVDECGSGEDNSSGMIETGITQTVQCKCVTPYIASGLLKLRGEGGGHHQPQNHRLHTGLARLADSRPRLSFQRPRSCFLPCRSPLLSADVSLAFQRSERAAHRLYAPVGRM